MSFTFPCHRCKEEVTMIHGVQVCLNCGQGFWLKEKNGAWQNEDDFLVIGDGKYLVVPFEIGSSKDSIKNRILTGLRKLLPPWH
jgi:hypothetical protein